MWPGDANTHAEIRNIFRVKILVVGGVTLSRRRHVVYALFHPNHTLQEIPAIKGSFRHFLTLKPNFPVHHLNINGTIRRILTI
jgi:hypothetical protein